MAGQYKTRCPHCGAQFKISDEHLEQARGAVRCGSCLQIFQATDHLVGETPPPNDQTGQWQYTLDDDETDAQPDGDNSSLGDIELSDSFLSLDRDGDEGLGEDFSDMQGAGRAGGSEDTDEAWAEALLEDLEDEDEPAPATAPPPKTPPPAASRPDPISEDDDQFEFLNSTSARRHKAVNERLDYMAPPPSGPALVIKWGLLSVLALLVLAGQYAFFHFDTLARSPQWRPLYAEACQLLGCRLPLRTDLSRLRGANLVVRSHPHYQNALMVDALLFNEGDWPQPFPALELTFKDLRGNTVATRRFAPSEYLRGELAGLDAMPVNTPVHIALEIVDPGEQAVSYNLRLRAPEPPASRVSQRPD
ncbi:MAG TPA: zinc-ribbon and DUF3426 domain-containing protein [Alcanivorax sp.]|nr:zinc-ribbon and DUF3426 domain-containing protein [Alcanivorax sp.]